MKRINNGADGAKQVSTDVMIEARTQKKAPIFIGAFLKLRAITHSHYLSVSNLIASLLVAVDATEPTAIAV